MNDSVFRKPTAAASTIVLHPTPPAPRTEWRLGSFSTVLGVGLIVLGLVLGFGIAAYSISVTKSQMVRYCDQYQGPPPVALYAECVAIVARGEHARGTLANWLGGIPLAVGALVLFKAWKS